MRMRYVVNFLMIFLLGFAQVDDLIFVDGPSPSDPVTSNDDEFLPAECAGSEVSSPTRQGLNLGKIIPDGVVTHCAFTQGRAFPEACRPQLFAFSSLYVFMSLRR
jgi:hypothetical protein